MKALSVKQPYASLIVEGEKTIEVRSWKTDYRGDILIISSARPAYKHEFDDMPNGVLVGVVELVDIVPLQKKHLYDAYMDEDLNDADLVGQFAWILKNPRIYDSHLPVKGKLKLFEVPMHIDEQGFLVFED